MHRILFAALIAFSTSVYGQVVIRKYYDKNDEVTDSAGSYYYREGKAGRIIDLSHPGWTRINDVLKPSLDTVVSYYCQTGKIKAREIYYEGHLNGPFVSYYDNGRISKKAHTRMTCQ